MTKKDITPGKLIKAYDITGSVTNAAKELNVSRETYYKYMRKFGASFTKRIQIDNT